MRLASYDKSKQLILEEARSMEKQELSHIKQQCLSGKKWIRLIFMVIFATVSYFGLFLIWLIGLFQFIFHLMTGKANEPLLKFSQSMNSYLTHIISYLCFNEENKPFPFKEWPSCGKSDCHKKNKTDSTPKS